MKITTQTIRRIIKEELRKVLTEDLYDDPSEKEEAIKKMMDKFGISYAEAADVIGHAGDDYSLRQQSQISKDEKEEREKAAAIKAFEKAAKRGRGFGTDFAAPAQKAAEEFLQSPPENPHESIQTIHAGFTHCMERRFAGKEYDEIMKRIMAGDEEMRKHPLFRDLQAYNQLKQGNIDLDTFQDETQSECLEKFGYALISAYDDLKRPRRSRSARKASDELERSYYSHLDHLFEQRKKT